ncbi:zinc finger protein 551 isoform X1 [Scleropages formosus]|uniref:zinc finger protein 551 isoform X1 n=2 Tax=Scleropages formosus TaxID=113540 RepID=UPI0010FA6B36|nr:zinc finger protein 551-like isoform X1 [Scleropages formosus]
MAWIRPLCLQDSFRCFTVKIGACAVFNFRHPNVVAEDENTALEEARERKVAPETPSSSVRVRAMADSVKTFQSHLTSVLDSLVRASVCEITKLFQDTVKDYLVEISLNRKENEALKLRLRLTENKLRNERKYGMGWAAGRRAPGLLVSEESGRRKRKSDAGRTKHIGSTAFTKDWPTGPWQAGSATTGEAGGAPRDVYLVQLPGGEEEEEEEAVESTARESEETTNIKEESTDLEGYRPESLQLIHEVLQMDPADQNLGDTNPGAELAGTSERTAVEPPQCESEWASQITSAGGPEKLAEQQRTRHGVEELPSLETGLKAERGAESATQCLGQSGAEREVGDFGSQASESIENTLGDLEYVMAQKYIGLDGLCSSEQDAAHQTAQAPDGDADGVLEVHGRMVPALPHSETRGFSSMRVKEGIRSLSVGTGDLRSSWPKRTREGEAASMERLALQPAQMEQGGMGTHMSQVAGVSTAESGGDPGDFVHLCNQCGYTFNSAGDLEEHPCLLSVQEQQHTCTLCGKSFNQASHLLSHVRLHTEEAGERPYRCAQCGRSFNQSWNLKNHECVHSEQRPHRCELCGKRFTHSRSLERHQLVHTGERPHRCPQCGRSFSRLGNLERHQRIHTGERPYGCAACGKRFSRVEYLKRHQQIHNGERLAHQCGHCGKTFSEPEQLKNHQCFYTI